ncbi:CvpA family protein [Coprobacter tertius]|uniref:CvpA family protein n=1 Tax=Coprobacter tertius TaxID=2944915 RepID=A0ABT1MIY6_9BACT|nr:CvpA family protein [Coprobacter tertius]MCP9612589.1 CvpA family protein [Coprobacter tertius]
MGYFDIFIGGILCIGIISGLMRGLVRQIGSLASLVLAIVGSYLFGNFTETLLIGLFDVPLSISHSLAYLLTFLVIYLVGRLIAYFCLRVVRWVQLGFLDRLAGAVFSVFKYVLIISIFINIYEFIDRDSHWMSKSKKENSYFYACVREVAPTLFSLAVSGK